MWIAGLCSFPPLFAEEPIGLNAAGASITKPFHAPVEKSYPLAVSFYFPSTEARLKDQVVGDRFDNNCQGETRYEDIPEIQRKGLGRPIPFKVVIRKKADSSIVLSRTFVSLCVTSHDGKSGKTRIVGWLPLPIGDYIAEVTNLEAQPGLATVSTVLSLYGDHGK
jgi:hypothetical protein